MNRQLSQNFSLQELTISQTAARKGIDNTPSQSIIETLIMTCDRMEKVRQICGNRAIFVSSGYRSPAVNKAIGGAKTSHHMTGHAVDFSVSGLTIAGTFALLKKAHDNGQLKYDQLINEYGRWIHISFAPSMRGQAFRIG